MPDAFPSGFGCLPGCRKNYCHGVAALRTPAFRGRLRERRVLDHLLDGVRSGESAVLVIRGEAGVGKTALLHYCARQAAGCRLAQIAGVESELELPFAALHQLCHPMLGGIAALPKPQEEALQVAFGLMTGTAPDRFLVGLAVLSLLAEVGVGRPLVCLVDDAQWLDAASAQVLGFVGRRLLAESVLLLFAVREAGEERMFPALPALNVEGLTDSDARRRSWPPQSPAGSTSASATGWSPRPAAIPWRSWNWSAG